MLAFRPFDTNNSAHQARLGLSPPSKKCDKSPSKVPINGDMLFRCEEPTNDQSSFKFNLQSVTIQSSDAAAEARSGKATAVSDESKSSVKAWQAALIAKIDAFESEFASRKAALLKTMTEVPDEEFSQNITAFLKDMDSRSTDILKC